MELLMYKDNCRLCLKSRTESMKNIFNHRLEDCKESLAQNVCDLFGVELQSFPDYPQSICRKCLTEIENMLLFKVDVLHNQKFLLGLFHDSFPNCVEERAPFKSIARFNFHVPEVKSVAINTEFLPEIIHLKDAKVPLKHSKKETSILNKENSKEKLTHFKSTKIRYTAKVQKNVTKKNQRDLKKNTYVASLSKCRVSPLNRTPQLQVNDHLDPAASEETQALFLQNFNLIAKQNADLVKIEQTKLTKRKTTEPRVPKFLPKPLVNRPNIKTKPIIANKNKSVANRETPSSRSMRFLERYGWRNSNHISTRGTNKLLVKNSLLNQSIKPQKNCDIKTHVPIVKKEIKTTESFEIKRPGGLPNHVIKKEEMDDKSSLEELKCELPSVADSKMVLRSSQSRERKAETFSHRPIKREGSCSNTSFISVKEEDGNVKIKKTKLPKKNTDQQRSVILNGHSTYNQNSGLQIKKELLSEDETTTISGSSRSRRYNELHIKKETEQGIGKPWPDSLERLDEISPRKFINVDLEDSEVQMLVLIDDEEACFDNDFISKFVKVGKKSLSDINQNVETPSVKRKGRPPKKYTPSVYEAHRSASLDRNNEYGKNAARSQQRRLPKRALSLETSLSPTKKKPKSEVTDTKNTKKLNSPSKRDSKKIKVSK